MPFVPSLAPTSALTLAALLLPIDEGVDQATERRSAPPGLQVGDSISWRQAVSDEALDLIENGLAPALGCALSISRSLAGLPVLL